MGLPHGYVATPKAPSSRENVRPAPSITSQTTRVRSGAAQAPPPPPEAPPRSAPGPMLSFASASAPQLTTSARSVGRGLGRLTRTVLLVILLMGALVCGLSYATYNQFFTSQNTSSTTVNQSGATTLADGFAQAISTQHYDQAYNDLGPGLAEKNQFTQDAQSEDQCNGPITTYKRVSATMNGNKLVETYEMTRSKLANTYNLTLTLQGDSSGRWQITDYQSGAPACPSS